MNERRSAGAPEDQVVSEEAGSTESSRVQETASDGWLGQDLDAFAAKVTAAFHEAKKKAIQENIELFGRAEGVSVKPS